MLLSSCYARSSGLGIKAESAGCIDMWAGLVMDGAGGSGKRKHSDGGTDSLLDPAAPSSSLTRLVLILSPGDDGYQGENGHFLFWFYFLSTARRVKVKHERRDPAPPNASVKICLRVRRRRLNNMRLQ